MAVASKRQRTSSSSPWPDMRPELLGAVLRRLPSLADRVRLRAVCRPWRSLPPTHFPQLPWLAFRDGTLLDTTNNAAHRARLPDVGAVSYSAGENALFLMHDDGRCSLVMDVFSGAVTPLPELAALLRTRDLDPRNELLQPITKVAVSPVAASAPHHPLVAVVVHHSKVFISTCRPAGETNSCLVMDDYYFDFSVGDVAFFQGKMYLLSRYDYMLVAFELNNGCLDEPTPPGVEVRPEPGSSVTVIEAQESWEKISTKFRRNFRNFGYFGGCRLHDHSADHLHDPWRDHRVVGRYLVESGGKLLMVKRWIRKPGVNMHLLLPGLVGDPYDEERTRRFEVFEAADMGDGRGRWKEVHGLGGGALFVSTPCSRFAAPAAGHGAQEDCIYFVHQYYFGRPTDDPLGGSGVYNLRDGTIAPLMPEPAALPATLPWIWRFPAWVFPVQV